MRHNYVVRDINQALPILLEDLSTAPEIGSRAGRVRELTHVGITLEEPWRREILLQHRKAALPAQIAESAWVLAGRNDIGWLSHYLPRAADYSDDGETWRGAYGARIRKWRGLDQLRYVVDLLNRDRSSRQAVIGIWDPSIDTQPGKDVCCNDLIMFLSRLGKLDLHVAIRSNDAMWGWSGINAFEWSVLQEVVAGLLGIGVGALHFSTNSFHLYDRHWAKADRIVSAASVTPSAAESPRFDAEEVGRDLASFDLMLSAWFNIEELIRTAKPAEYDPSVDLMIDEFPEPMFQSWLRVLRWWWTGERVFLEPLRGTALHTAAGQSLQPPEREDAAPPTYRGREALRTPAPDSPAEVREATPEPPEQSPFIRNVLRLHNEKHAAYGDSWKRRGETLGILANIARKVDRLGGAETSDETSADTAIDAAVYLAKYRVWLGDTDVSDTPDAANWLLLWEDQKFTPAGYGWIPLTDEGVLWTENYLRETFEVLSQQAADYSIDRLDTVDSMLTEAYRLARTLWERVADSDYRGADSD